MALANRQVVSNNRFAASAPGSLPLLRGRRVQTRVLSKQPELSSYSDTETDSKPSTSCRTGSLEEVSSVLFNRAHMEDLSRHPSLALYMPIGLALATIRSVLWIAGIALDAPWFRNQAVVDGYLKLLGVKVTWVNPERIPAGRHLLVSNHCTVGDLMMLFTHPSLPQRYTHLITSALPPRVTACKHLPVLLRPASPATYDQLAAAAASGEDSGPIHLFPEGGMTNGRGMLRFSRGFTRIMNMAGSSSSSGGGSSSSKSGGSSMEAGSSGSSMEEGGAAHQQQQGVQHHQPHHAAAQHHQGAHTPASQHPASASSSSHDGAAATSIKLPPGTSIPTTTTTTTTTSSGAASPSSPSSSGGGGGGVLPVVPVALRARTMAGVNTHTLTSSFMSNLFWMGFSPATELHATVLPAMTPAPGESRAAFVNRVQGAIAQELGVEVYDLTIQQKRQLAARRGG